MIKKINLTSTVSDLKKVVYDKYNISIEIYTLKDNVAGESRKIRALISSKFEAFPILLEENNGNSFIKNLINDYGMNVKIMDEIESTNTPSQKVDLTDFLKFGVYTSANILNDTIHNLYQKKDEKGLETLMGKLIEIINNDGIYYWLFYVAKIKIFECYQNSGPDFEYNYEGDCEKFNPNDFCLFFNPKSNVISPFTSGKDYSWGTEENSQNDYFEISVLKKIGLTSDELEEKDKFTYIQHASFTILICSLIHWINDSQVSEIDLANCFLSIMDPKGQSDENLIQLCCDLPNLICQHIVGIDFDEFNSELDSSNEMFGDYVHDWIKISGRILEEETFYSPS
jgi:hypothetical protein